MSNLSDISKLLAKIDGLVRDLNLRQLQVNRLLTLTQAINNNVKAPDLFAMYHSFLSWELEIRKMALYVKSDDEEYWACATNIGLSKAQQEADISLELASFRELINLESSTHPFLSQFDLVIPVLHKEQPIAYVFIGGFEEDEDMYEKVQFITTITNIVAVAIENKRLFKRQIEQERLSREIELAGEMQRMLIPEKLPANEHYQMASIYQPHFGVGGDYFDYLEFEDGTLAFCIGDISGKGMAAALLMANFQANFNTLINKRTPLDEFITDLNLSVNRITEGERFITFFVAEYDRSTKVLRYVNAGHNPPVLASANNTTLLKKGCTILGSFTQLPEIEIGEVTINEPSTLLTYTDGLIDLQNQDGEYFDDEKVKTFVSENHQLTAKEFNNTLHEKLNIFKGDDGDYPDDFTVLTTKIFPH